MSGLDILKLTVILGDLNLPYVKLLRLQPVLIFLETASCKASTALFAYYLPMARPTRDSKSDNL